MLFARAVEFHLQGRAKEALAFYDAAIRGNPGIAAAHSNRGLLLQTVGRLDEAIRSFDHAIALQPGYADAHYNRGITLRLLGRLAEAVCAYDQALSIQSDHFDAWNNRGVALRQLGKAPEALQSFERAIALQEDSAVAHYNRGDALQDVRRHAEAVASYDRAAAIRPDFAAALNNRANALRVLQRPEEALRDCNRALELDRGTAEPWIAKGNALKDLGRFGDAVASYDRAITLSPDHADAYWNKSLCVLLMEDFEEGWPLYEWRKKKSGSPTFPDYPKPLWSGEESLEGKTLLIYAEQGLGDTIQFCRYAQLAQKRNAKVVFAVPEALVRLLSGLGPGIEIIAPSLPAQFDYHIPLLSLPLAFRTDVGNCPSNVPYLRPEAERINRWRERLGTHGFKIGICWQGSKSSEIDVGRSFPLRWFERLAKLSGVRLFSLQRWEGTEQIRDLPLGMRVEELGDDFDAPPDAFIDTAAVMESLDLVITSDTAIAHLAGALARPTWVALKHVPDWRWLLDRSDSPWYPTMRLFRQPIRDDWAAVFAEMETQLVAVLTRRYLPT